MHLVHDHGFSEYGVKIIAEVDIPDLTEYFEEKKMLKRLDLFIILAHVAGTQAIRDSGIDIDKAPRRYGCIIGASGGVLAHYDNIQRIAQGNLRAVSSFYIVSALPNTASGYPCPGMNLEGPLFFSSLCLC